METFVADMNK
jgi:hypothetical protein